MAIALVVEIAAGSSDSLFVTSSAINTTGANFLAVWVSNTGGNQLAPFDNNGNTWTPLTAEVVGGGERGQWWYVASPIVGAGHTFSWNTDFAGAGVKPAIAVKAFSGVTTVSPFDQETGTSTFPNNLQPGTQTPSADGCVVLQGLAYNTAGTTGINESYVFAGDGTDYIDQSGNTLGMAAAYKIQTTATATNPTWTNSNSSSMAGRSASFKAGGGGGGPAEGMVMRGVDLPHNRVGPMVLRQGWFPPAIQDATKAPVTNTEFGARIDLPHPFVGPMALRQGWRPQPIQDFTQAPVTDTQFGTGPVRVPNPYVGPPALRQKWRQPPYFNPTQAPITNTEFGVGNVRIPNPQVGPMALRRAALRPTFFGDSTAAVPSTTNRIRRVICSSA